MFNRITPFLASHRRHSSRLILGADDFGRSSDVNQAVEQAWGAGMLTSASLMVTGDAFAEAADFARRMPGLAVGLHLVLADGRAVLPPHEISHLVDARGRFPRDPLCAGLRYALLGRRGRDELQRELAAQFERFASTGLPLAHVDGHCHLHAHPAVFGRMVRLAKKFGARGIRLPRDSFGAAYRHDQARVWRQAAWASILSLLCRGYARRLRREGMATASHSYGLFESGHMREGYVLDLLRRLREPTAEVYFHPTLGPRLDPLGPNRGDLETLLSPQVRSMIEACGLVLTNYLALGRMEEGAHVCDAVLCGGRS
jgi:chitin disaccharide deacetylase